MKKFTRFPGRNNEDVFVVPEDVKAIESADNGCYLYLSSGKAVFVSCFALDAANVLSREVK